MLYFLSYVAKLFEHFENFRFFDFFGKKRRFFVVFEPKIEKDASAAHMKAAIQFLIPMRARKMQRRGRCARKKK